MVSFRTAQKSNLNDKLIVHLAFHFMSRNHSVNGTSSRKFLIEFSTSGYVTQAVISSSLPLINSESLCNRNGKLICTINGTSSDWQSDIEIKSFQGKEAARENPALHAEHGLAIF